MGVVYKCRDITAGVEVALKPLPPELCKNEHEMAEIKETFRTVYSLHHPDIASCNNLEYDRSTGNYYLVMEYVEGENLRDWIEQNAQNNGRSSEMVIQLVKRIADALDYAHKQNAVHGDIRPEHIAIASDGTVKILAFGLAAQIRAGMVRIAMTPYDADSSMHYIAPEQWQGDPRSAAADQYALGVMAYEMLSGHLPFDSPYAYVLREMVLHDTPASLTGVPSYIQGAIRRAMSRSPYDRFLTCADFSAALTASPASLQEKHYLPWIILLAALLGVAILVLLAGGIFNQRIISRENARKMPQVDEERRPEDMGRQNSRKPASEAERRAAEAEPETEMLPAPRGTGRRPPAASNVKTRRAYIEKIVDIIKLYDVSPDDPRDFLAAADAFLAGDNQPVTAEECEAFARLIDAFAPTDEKIRFVPFRSKARERHLEVLAEAERARKQERLEREARDREEAEALRMRLAREEEERRRLQAERRREEIARIKELTQRVDAVLKPLIESFPAAVNGDRQRFDAATKAADDFMIPSTAANPEEQRIVSDFNDFRTKLPIELERLIKFRLKITDMHDGFVYSPQGGRMVKVVSMLPDGRLVCRSIDGDRQLIMPRQRGVSLQRLMRGLKSYTGDGASVFCYLLMIRDFEGAMRSGEMSSFWRRHLKTFVRFSAAQ